VASLHRVIRPARPEDVPAIHDLVCELAAFERARHEVTSTPQMLAAALFADSPAVFAHVAEVDGTVVAFAQWYVTFSTWIGRHGIWLDDLYVRPEHRGGGHGTALLAELAALALERGYARVEWWVLDWNEPAIAFYRSIRASAMDEWTVQRLHGSALRDMAARRGATSPRRADPETLG